MRYVLLIAIALGVFAVFTRRQGTWHLFYVLLGITVLYTILKLTGVIEALAPTRNGV